METLSARVAAAANPIMSDTVGVDSPRVATLKNKFEDDDKKSRRSCTPRVLPPPWFQKKGEE